MVQLQRDTTPLLPYTLGNSCLHGGAREFLLRHTILAQLALGSDAEAWLRNEATRETQPRQLPITDRGRMSAEECANLEELIR
eukprot:370294-Rhodomonas_salina.1